MDDVRGYLQRKGLEFRVAGDEAIMNCPFCGDTEKKFAINIRTGRWNCLHKSRCGKTGGLKQLQVELGDVPKVSETRREYRRPGEMGELAVKETDPVLRYLSIDRHLSPEVIRAYGIRNHRGLIVFPYTKGGVLVNNKYRSLDKKFHQEKDAEQVLFGRDMIGEGVSELIIVEGEIDCLTLRQMGFGNVVSVPSGAGNLDWIEVEWEWLDSFDAIYLGLDVDKAGEEAVAKIAQRIGPWRCRRVTWPMKDPNECLANGYTGEQLAGVVAKAQEMRPESIRLLEEYMPEILAGQKRGVSLGFPNLDAILGGCREQEVTVWTGRNGDGKTTFLNQLMLNFVAKESKVCMASLEMKPAWVGRWMMYQAGCEPTPEGATKFKGILKGSIVVVDNHGMTKGKELLEWFEYIARRWGCQHYVLDSLMRVDIGQGEGWLQRQTDFMNGLVQFAIDWGVHVHLVAHPRKGTADSEHVDKVDIAGSYDITNLASNVISIRRNKESEGPGATLEVMKNREMGRLGKVKMAFDRERRRFVELTSPPLDGERTRERVIGRDD